MDGDFEYSIARFYSFAWYLLYWYLLFSAVIQLRKCLIRACQELLDKIIQKYGSFF